MIPVHQDRFGDRGNCVAACYATLLGLELDQVPDLCVDRQWDAECAWLATLGLGLVRMHQGQRPLEQTPHGLLLADGVPYMASGVSPRGYGHRVLALEGQLLHDPHPEGGGLVHVDAVLFVVRL